jgi:hypothetical protein
VRGRKKGVWPNQEGLGLVEWKDLAEEKYRVFQGSGPDGERHRGGGVQQWIEDWLGLSTGGMARVEQLWACQIDGYHHSILSLPPMFLVTILPQLCPFPQFLLHSKIPCPISEFSIFSSNSLLGSKIIGSLSHNFLCLSHYKSTIPQFYILPTILC